MSGRIFHHTMLMRLRTGVTLDRVRGAREALAALAETLPGVLHFAVTDNLSGQNRGFTLALFSVFDNRQAYEIFQRHPERRRVWHELLESVVEEFVVGEGEGG